MDHNEGKLIQQLVNKKQFLLESQKDVILDILSREEPQQILNNIGEFRARTYTPLKTLYTNILEVLSSDKSAKNAVAGVNAGRLVSDKTPVCPSTGSFNVIIILMKVLSLGKKTISSIGKNREDPNG